MILKLNNDRGIETVDVAFRNIDGAGSITQTQPVCYVVDGASVSTANAMHSRAATFPGFTGLCLDASVAINGWGRARAWGHGISVMISNETTSITITAGDALTLVSGLGLGMSSVGGFTFTILNTRHVMQTGTLTLSQGQAYGDRPLIRAL